MLAPNFSWSKVKAAVTYLESDCVARIRTSGNALAWLPVFINQADNRPYVQRYGSWELVEGLAGFEAYEPVKNESKALYDTTTNELIGAV
jgi:hypothetical protein